MDDRTVCAGLWTRRGPAGRMNRRGPRGTRPAEASRLAGAGMPCVMGVGGLSPTAGGTRSATDAPVPGPRLGIAGPQPNVLRDETPPNTLRVQTRPNTLSGETVSNTLTGMSRAPATGSQATRRLSAPRLPWWVIALIVVIVVVVAIWLIGPP